MLPYPLWCSIVNFEDILSRGGFLVCSIALSSSAFEDAVERHVVDKSGVVTSRVLFKMLCMTFLWMGAVAKQLYNTFCNGLNVIVATGRIGANGTIFIKESVLCIAGVHV